MSVDRYTKSVPPSTEIIQSMINAEISLKIAIAELIANSLDQDATQIDISLNTKRRGLEELVISDNGNGCQNLELMVKLGSHVPSKRGSIGRYGVGFKDAAIWLGGEVFVDSLTRGGKKEKADANWAIMKATGKWDVGFRDDSERTSHGVTIRIGALDMRRITNGWKLVSSYITEKFSAAIDDHVVITVDGIRVKSAPRPLLIDDVEFLIRFNGRVAKGLCGILVDKSLPSGWNVRYGPQTIVSSFTREGFGAYSSYGFWGMLYMIDDEKKWKLTRNKNASEDLADILECPDMQKVVVPFLDKLQQESQRMTMNLSHQLAVDDLNKMLQNIKKDIVKNPGCEEEFEGGRGKDKIPRSPRGPSNDKDGLLGTKRMISGINVISIRQESLGGKSLGYAELLGRKGDLLMVHIDNSTETGKNLCSDSRLLKHTAITLMALLFGTREDLQWQLTFPGLKETPSLQQKISMICAWLLKHVNFDELKATSGVA